jgi:two-component system LytT family response regulator
MTAAPLRALIVDDEPPARRRLRVLLRSEPAVEIVGEAGDGSAAVDAIARVRPDLVFLDVQMPGRDGFDVIEEVAVSGAVPCPAVIFVTAFDQYAVKAFDVHAIDYLLKPFDRARLHEAVMRASKLVGEPGLSGRLLDAAQDATRHRLIRRLIVRSAGRLLLVEVDAIDWIEATGHYVTVHAGRQTHLVRGRLTDLASRLQPGRFARIHRGTIVNLARVKELRPLFHGEFTVVLKDDTRLHSTRTYASELTTMLTTGG